MKKSWLADPDNLLSKDEASTQANGTQPDSTAALSSEVDQDRASTFQANRVQNFHSAAESLPIWILWEIPVHPALSRRRTSKKMAQRLGGCSFFSGSTSPNFIISQYHHFSMSSFLNVIISQYHHCGFWSNRTLPYFPLSSSSSVRPSVTGVTYQLFSIF